MKLTKIELLENYGPEMQLMHLTFDDGKDSAFIVWSHANLVQHLGEDVIATFRKDMYNGAIHKFVNTLACVGVVRTLDKDDHVKLYVDVTDNHSTVRFADIADGTTVKDAIVYVVDVRFDSSARADWADFTVMDQARKVAQLRIFSPDNKTASFKHHYVMCDIRRNKYGLSTDSLYMVDSAFHYSPEVETSLSYIQNAFADSPDILRLLSETKYLEFARSAPDLEPGYSLVRLAIELTLMSELSNLTKDVDVDMLKRCLLVDRFQVLQQASPYHQQVVNFVTASRYEYEKKGEVLLTLFSDDPRYKKERAILRSVQELAETVVAVKKGLVV